MKNILLLIFFLFSRFTFSQYYDHTYFQQNGEVYFKFPTPTIVEIRNLTKIISIDKVTKDFVYAYASEIEYNNILKKNIAITILPHPGDVDVKMSDSPAEIKAWDVYPTYDAYIQMMQDFATSYPNLCKIVEAGVSIQNRKILYAVISKNILLHPDKPQVMYSSSMHGDELTGYVNMLRLIDYLLTNYTTDPQVAYLLDNTEIWINPSANPDGTYWTGNASVTGARRYNRNSVDLNRNWPDFVSGPHPDGNAFQIENIAQKNTMDANHFVMSANFHGGAEVVNYPWDNMQALHPDDAWFFFISRQFADTVHKFSTGTSYLTDFNNGITNGYAWYAVAGGRQDYMTYTDRGREVTMEISSTKLPAATQLPTYWNYLKQSFLNYIKLASFGITGIISDTSGNKVKAKVTISGHDFNNSDIFSDSITGRYRRLIIQGTYNLTISAPNYYTKTINGVNVVNNQATLLNIQLIPINPIPVELVNFSATNGDGFVTLKWSTATETNNKGFEIERTSSKETKVIGFKSGSGTTSELSNYSFVDNNPELGTNSYRLKQIDFDGTTKYSSSVELKVVMQAEFELMQNYPNPVSKNNTSNQSTKIKYIIENSSKVTLAIYNSLGETIRVLRNNELLSHGDYTDIFDVKSLPSGVYFYKLSVNDKSQIKSLIVIK